MSSVVLATAGYDHTIRFWEATSGICYRTLQYADSQVGGGDTRGGSSRRHALHACERTPGPLAAAPSAALLLPCASFSHCGGPHVRS